MKTFIFILTTVIIQFSYSQIDSLKVNTKYLEDQFYFGITYNLLINKPAGVNQYNLSRGVSAGYIRDIPLNQERNVGLGAGIGYGYNLIYTNIKPTLQGDKMVYDIVSVNDEKISKSYYQYHAIEFTPIEFRWRTSTPTTFRFWRVYSGIKVAYLFGSNYRLVSETEKLYLKSPDTQNYWEWKAYLALGRGSWNGYVQYAFTPFLRGKQTQSGTLFDMNLINIGFIFYIL